MVSPDIPIQDFHIVCGQADLLGLGPFDMTVKFGRGPRRAVTGGGAAARPPFREALPEGTRGCRVSEVLGANNEG